MPGRLIIFIVILCFVALFVGMNYEFQSDIRIWFGEKGLFKEVPIIFSFFIIYVAGLLSALPYALTFRARVISKMKLKKNNENPEKILAKKTLLRKKEQTESDKSENSEKN